MIPSQLCLKSKQKLIVTVIAHKKEKTIKPKKFKFLRKGLSMNIMLTI